MSDQVPGYDPVYTARYNQHIQHVFPNFTITNLEACHFPGTFPVPGQSETIPGVLSRSYELDTWYGGNDDTELIFGDTSGRNIGLLPEPCSHAGRMLPRGSSIDSVEPGSKGPVITPHTPYEQVAGKGFI